MGTSPMRLLGAPTASALLSCEDKAGTASCFFEVRRLTMKALTAVLTVAVAMWFCAQAPAQRERERLGERLQDLNLTDGQEAKIADIRKECRPEVEKAAKELAAVAQEELDKIRKILTPEQQQKLRAMAEERREH